MLGLFDLIIDGRKFLGVCSFQQGSTLTIREIAMAIATHATPWNKGRIVGQKSPLKLRDIWAIRTRLQLQKQWRSIAMFNLAIDSKLRASDLVALRVGDVIHGGQALPRAMVKQAFELMSNFCMNEFSAKSRLS